jgi:transmembrane sensor
MMNPPSRIQALACKWLAGTITDEEKSEFLDWYNDADDGKPINVPKEFAPDELSHSLRMYRNIYEKSQLSAQTVEDAVAPVRKLSAGRKWMPYAAAIIVVIGVAGYMWNATIPVKQVTVEAKPVPIQQEVTAPASSHAVITLANGHHIILDSIQNGRITTQGRVQLVKLDDEHIVYKGTSDVLTYNTLTNPRGSRVVHIILADGTKVWLNSESSLRYPTAFTGNERVVEITGETYFEVARNEAMPFKVKKDAMEVTVFGTHFNINSYEEEGKMAVTLLEGSVDVASAINKKTIHLKPGQQAQLSNTGNLSLSKEVNTDDVIAWKNGKFQFGEKCDIGAIMRRLARWYDVEVEYRGTVSQHFGGSISSDANLSQVLKVLETTGDVSFKVEGRKITVMP